MAALADDIYLGKTADAQDPPSKVKAMYELFKNVTKTNLEEFTSLVKYDLECSLGDRLMEIVLKDENNENNTIHKLQILIRDLQDKTPKIDSEVNEFIESQKKWRQEKEEEFQKSIETIRSQMAPSNVETGENEMMTKYKDLCEYVETMRKEVNNFKEALDKLVADRDEKLKSNMLEDSKRNIEEKIQTLKSESDRLKKELPASRKDYNTHKKESKKLISIIEANNKKKKEYKDSITKLNTDLTELKGKNKDIQSLVDALKSNLGEKKETEAALKLELADIMSECKQLQDKINEKK